MQFSSQLGEGMGRHYLKILVTDELILSKLGIRVFFSIFHLILILFRSGQFFITWYPNPEKRLRNFFIKMLDFPGLENEHHIFHLAY